MYIIFVTDSHLSYASMRVIATSNSKWKTQKLINEYLLKNDYEKLDENDIEMLNTHSQTQCSQREIEFFVQEVKPNTLID